MGAPRKDQMLKDKNKKKAEFFVYIQLKKFVTNKIENFIIKRFHEKGVILTSFNITKKKTFAYPESY